MFWVEICWRELRRMEYGFVFIISSPLLVDFLQIRFYMVLLNRNTRRKRYSMKKKKAFSRVSFVLFLFLTFFLSNYPHNPSSKVTRRLISVETRSLAFAYLLLWVQGHMHISATFYYYENLFLLVTFRLVNGEIFVEKNRLVFAPFSVT